MTSQYIDRREAARRVRTSLGVALAECGMKTLRGGKGWVRRFPESGNGVGVWIQFVMHRGLLRCAWMETIPSFRWPTLPPLTFGASDPDRFSLAW